MQSWGIGQRGSHLIAYEAFAEVIASRASEIAKPDDITIDNPALDAQQTPDQVWALIDSLAIVDNKSKIVACSKALHHLLPDLVVPIDQVFTRTFFGLHVPEFYGKNQPQQSVFTQMFLTFVRIAQTAAVNSYVVNSSVDTEQPWRTSRSKVIDNAIVGFCVAKGLPTPS